MRSIAGTSYYLKLAISGGGKLSGGLKTMELPPSIASLLARDYDFLDRAEESKAGDIEPVEFEETVSD